MARSGSNEGAIPFVLPALIAPYGLLASIAWAINDWTGLHGVICIGIFGGLVWGMVKFVPAKWQAGFGMLIVTLLIFGTLAAVKVDKIWATFWAGLYLVGTYFAFQAVWGSADDAADDDGETSYGFWASFRDNLFDGGSDGGSSSAAKPQDSRVYHQKAGTCRGTSAITGNKSGHTLLKCGRCSTAGCTDLNCTNRNFHGTKCLTCDLSANTK